MKSLINLREWALDNLGKMVLVATLAPLTLTGTYFLGNYRGIEEGERRGKEDLIMNLSMDRYDAHQNAKYARSLERQKEILKDCDSITKTLELLDKNGYFKGVSDDTYKHAFPNRDKSEKIGK